MPPTFWRLTVVAWIGLISFSSTSVASEWSEQGFRYLSQLLFSELPPTSSPYGVIHLLADKGVHVTLFCVLALLLWKALPDAPAKPLIILACGAVVGSYSEFLQRFFPGRDPAIRDALINTSATALGILICEIARRHSLRRS